MNYTQGLPTNTHNLYHAKELRREHELEVGGITMVGVRGPAQQVTSAGALQAPFRVHGTEEVWVMWV